MGKQSEIIEVDCGIPGNNCSIVSQSSGFYRVWDADVHLTDEVPTEKIMPLLDAASGSPAIAEAIGHLVWAVREKARWHGEISGRIEIQMELKRLLDIK